MTNRIKKYTSYILIFCVIFINLGISVFATDHSTPEITETTNGYMNETNVFCSSTSTEHNHSHNTQITIHSNNVNSGESILVSFDNSAIEHFTCVENEVEIINAAEGCISFSLRPEIEFGSLEIVFAYTDGDTASKTVYIYNRSGKSFVSSFSIDDAFMQGLDYDYERRYISQSDRKMEYANFIQDYFYVVRNASSTECNSSDTILPEENSVSATSTDSNSLILSIHFYWHPDATHTLPLRNTKVLLYEMMGTAYRHLNSSYTDENGLYYVEIPYDQLDYYLDGGKILIDIEPEGRRMSLSGGLQGYYEYELTTDIALGELNEFDFYLSYNNELSLYRYMYIIQCLLIGERFAHQMGANLYGEHLTIHYPYSLPITFCWQGNVYIEENYYSSADTLLHEYGHFIQQTQGFGLDWDDLETVPEHTLSEDKMEAFESKEFATKLAWTESWATAFSVIAQYEFREEYSGIYAFGNLWYMNNNIETPILTVNSGEFQEISIIAMLWDLYDSAAESHDTLSLGAQKWWDYTAREGTVTLTDFIENVQTYYSFNMQKIGSIMSANRISPVLMVKNSASVSKSVSPQLSWTINGSANNPNDRFDVVIYDQYGEELYSVSGLNGNGCAYNEQYNYTIPSAIWENIMDAYAGTFSINIMVYSYHSAETPLSGPYPSNQVSLEFDYSNQSFNFYGSNRYIEKSIKMVKDQSCIFTVTFQTNGPKLIQTFGGTDTIVKLYSSSGTLLASNDDAGYSYNGLISYDTTAGESYIIEISFYIDEEDTDYSICYTKLVITPANTVRTSGTAITSYENIVNIENVTSYQSTIILNDSSTTVVRFTPKTAGSYTIKTTGDYDTYLYIIDPRSHEKISISSYNDDGGDAQNASLTIKLDANISYLIIISPYNPSTVDDFIACKLHINLNQ